MLRRLFSVLFVFGLFLTLSWSFTTTSVYGIQQRALYWNYFSHILMIALGFGAIALTKQEFVSSGFTIENWRSDISIAFICVISAAAFLPSLIFPAIANSAIMNAAIEIGATCLALFFVSKKSLSATNGKQNKTPLVVASFFPLILLASSISASLVVSTVIFQFFFAGFGEEILFRGYIQTNLNDGFGKPWKLAGVGFGPGLIITSLLFGVMHLLNPFNPLQGQYALALFSGVSSTVAGFLFGFLREKTGNVLAPSIAHGLIDLGQVVPLLL